MNKKLSFWKLTKLYFFLILFVKFFIWMEVIKESGYYYLIVLVSLFFIIKIRKIQIIHQASFNLYLANLAFFGGTYFTFFRQISSYREWFGMILNQAYLYVFGAIILAISHSILDILIHKKEFR